MRILEPLKNQSESWKSPGNLCLKKGTNPVYCFWVLQFYLNPLTPVQSVMSLGLPLLTSSLLAKIGIIYTQLLQVEKIFPIIPRSECSAKWCLRYAQKVEWKSRSKICCHYTWLLHGKICPSRWRRFLWSLLTASKPIRRTIPAAKKKSKGEKGKAKKKKKN